MMRELLRTFCENILRFLTIIGEKCCLLQNELILIGYPRSRRTSFGAIPY